MPQTPGRVDDAGLGVLGRLGDFAYSYSTAILITAAILTAVGGWFASSVFDAVKPFGFQDPDSESARADALYKETTGVEAVPGIVAVVHSTSPARVREVAGLVAGVPGVRTVTTGLDPNVRGAVSRNGRLVLVLGYLDRTVDDRAEVGADAEDALAGERGVDLGGIAVASEQINSRSESDLRYSELLALPVLFLLSLWIFRGLIAALLPLVVAAVAIVAALAVTRAFAEVVDIDLFTINLVTALGFGLAIDYCLFIISRFREQLAEQGAGPSAVIETMRTAGRTVAFSSLTIAGASAALLVFPQRYLYSMGIGGAVVTLLCGLVVLTVLPAVLSMLGPRINALAPAGLQRRRSRRRGAWYRLARFVMRRPVTVALVTATAMVIAGLPFLRAELTQADARNLPSGTSARTVDTALSTQFAGDPGTALVVLVDRSESSDQRKVNTAIARLRLDPAVAEDAQTAVVRGGRTQVELPLTVDPNSDQAADLVEEARALDWGATALVFGRTAELVDQRESIDDHLPVAIAIIFALTFVLLFAMTRSVVLPLQALLMNVLTVGVALGVMVLVFQDGRFEGLLDYTSDGAIDRSVPILLFAIVFGLSTDYGIFVITRIQEERRRGASDTDAIALGIERSGQIVTAAALLLSVAIGALVLSDLVYNKQLAIGAVAGILVDATLVRGLLFPAVMRLCGRWTWWAPGWLRSLTGTTR